MAQSLHLGLSSAGQRQHGVLPGVGHTGHRRERRPRPGLPMRGIPRGGPHIAFPRRQEHGRHGRAGADRDGQVRIHEQDVVIGMRYDLQVGPHPRRSGRAGEQRDQQQCGRGG
ncbi:hypothetical protein BJ970_004247 [Saccharopolyspora phatthalungensis]|uniref:Uncharacterized protein n=1 Tax=Saccharopolyspora phatthalungensis TaxID=664693 RepID=A0A840QHI1_9PSEU|nr:hypothetical protein [Saccharopolyspora phatthalungensis]MBB5156713.1 hypothetical protein [Saccharopolyspora phatthalungensis]